MADGDGIIGQMIDEARRQSPGVLDRLAVARLNVFDALTVTSNVQEYAAGS